MHVPATARHAANMRQTKGILHAGDLAATAGRARAYWDRFLPSPGDKVASEQVSADQ